MAPSYIINMHLARADGEVVLRRGDSPVLRKKTRVLVIGGGVSGFTTAWAALDAGYQVTVVSPNERPNAYTRWLRLVAHSKGARLVTRKVFGDLLFQEEDLLVTYNADIIVNCTSLGASQSVSEEPPRGTFMRLVNDGECFPKVREVLVDAKPEGEDMLFMVPTHDEILIVGGLLNYHKENLAISSPEIGRLRIRCSKLVPGLENAQHDPKAPLVQWFHGTKFCVEKETRPSRDGSASRIIHSYGTAENDFTLSFGATQDTLALVDEVAQDVSVWREGGFPLCNLGPRPLAHL